MPTSDAQLVVVEEEQPVQVEAKPLQVHGAEVGGHQNVTPGADTEVRISPLEVTLAPKRAFSRLSQPPPLQLGVNRSPSYHSLTIMQSRSAEMETFVEEGSHATQPQLTKSKMGQLLIS